MTTKAPRGIRNNNPLNLRESPGDKTIWLYERTTDDDPEFEEFDIPEGGIRAAAITIRTYVKKYGVNSVRQLIQRWAPPVGKRPDGTSYTQDTRAYINVVCNALGVDADEQIDLLHWDNMLILLKTMIRHENGPAPRGWEGRTDGSWYSDSLIMRAMDMARIERPAVVQQVVASPTARAATVASAGATVLSVQEVLSVMQASQSAGALDTWALVRVGVTVLIVLACIYIVNRRAWHARNS
jgi:hypothetical protein